MKPLVLLTLILMMVSQPGCAPMDAPPLRPNIVIIMTDDQGYGDLGFHGNTVLDTPHIDALAVRSARVERFYVSPVCSPTRASLFTGRYNYRTRVIDTWRGRSMMDTEETTLAELLRDAGYGTGIFGKWHLGDCYPMRPIDQGFDESLVHRGGGLAQPSEPVENERRYTDPILFRNGEQVQSRGFCTDVYTDAAIAFMEQQHASGDPFLAVITTNAPHGPFHDVPPGLYEKYRGRDLTPMIGEDNANADNIARIFAMIENIDDNVGRVALALDRMDIENDTIIVYLHDNGAANMPRHNLGLRGGKGGVYEGGIRTPFFVCWPSRLRPGAAVDRIAAHIDILPTLLDAAGVSPPPDLHLDGRSLLPLLAERETDWPDRTIYLQSHRGDEPERYHHFAAIEERWKLVRPSGFGRHTAPPDTPFQLFDLLSDPYEQNDVAPDHPDIVKRLRDEYDAWFDDVSATREDNFTPPRIVIGSLHELTTVLTRQDWKPFEREGWGRTGSWSLQAAVEGRYAVRVLLHRPAVDAGSAVLHFGETQVTRDVQPGGRDIDFGAIALPAGAADLAVAITVNGEHVAPYQVTVSLERTKALR